MALPLNSSFVGAWLSLVERLVRDQEAGGSNPLAPTTYPYRYQKPTADYAAWRGSPVSRVCPVLCPPCAPRERSMASSTVCVCG
jgi:hypothetical protein